MDHDVAFAPDQEPRQQVTRPLHGIKYRQEDSIPVGQPFAPGRFGRLVPVHRRRAVPDAALEELANAMVDAESSSADNPTIPAGFTYLGQFVDHDITFDTTPVPEQLVDPQMVHNFRTPKLDLDCLYGLGPAASPYLYQRDSPAKFLLGVVAESNDLAGNKIKPPDDGQFDLPRNSEGFALIGDPRNDENLIVSQLHLAFLKFHNAVADEVEPNPSKQSQAFDEIRREVTWHYQWVVIEDFLKKIVDPKVVDDVLHNGRRIYHFEREPFIPVEFSVAAYRFGHSMVRDSYDHNRFFGPGSNRIGPGTLDLLFFFTGPRKERPLPGITLVSSPLPSNWIIDWRRFFEVGDFKRNLTRLIDSRLAPTLHDLVKALKVPGPPTSLAARNLRRGEAVALPTGQNLAARFGFPTLDSTRIAQSGPDGEVAEKHGLHEQTPLWYYLLKEAELVGEGRRLGPLGGRIVAEVLVGLLDGDPLSFRAQAPSWKPWIKASTPGQFAIADMLTFLETKSPIVNPLG